MHAYLTKLMENRGENMEERKEDSMGGFKGSEGQKEIIILKTSKMKEAIFKNKIRIFCLFYCLHKLKYSCNILLQWQ